jgi:hypothetical protein
MMEALLVAQSKPAVLMTPPPVFLKRRVILALALALAAGAALGRFL